MVANKVILSAEEFVRLRLSSDPEEYQISARASASNDVWQDVISRFPEMKAWVVHNKTVPLEILEILICDNDSNVRCAVASKRKLRDPMLEKLAGDSDISVRMALAYNAKLPSHLIDQLKRDPSEAVRKAMVDR